MENNSSNNSKRSIRKAHDRYFRGAMDDQEVALSFVRAHLPKELVAQIDPHSLVLVKESFIEENLQEFITDVVYKARFHEHPGYLYFLMEHQSSPDPLMALRLHRYILQIIEQDLAHQKENPKKLPLVVPHVVYNGKQNYTHSTDIFELFHDPEQARQVFLKPFGLTVLKDIKDEDLRKEPLIGMVELLLKHAATRDFIFLVEEILGDIFQSLEKLKKERLFNLSASYFFEAQKRALSKKMIQEEFEKSRLPSIIKSKVMTIAESLKQEGRQEGEVTLLVRQLNHRFANHVTKKYLQLLEQADCETLSEWGENLLDAKTIEDVFKKGCVV